MAQLRLCVVTLAILLVVEARKAAGINSDVAIGGSASNTETTLMQAQAPEPSTPAISITGVVIVAVSLARRRG